MKKTVKKPLKKAQAGTEVKTYTKTNMLGKSKNISEEEHRKKYLKYMFKPNTDIHKGTMDIYDDKGTKLKLDIESVRPRKNSKRHVTEFTQTPYKKGGSVKKMAKGGSTFGMLSVKAGVDKNPKPTAADRIAGAKMSKKKMGGALKTKKK